MTQRRIYRPRRLHAGRPRHRGALLLEVLFSLVLLTASLTVIGLQINTALTSAQQSQQQTRANMLLRSKLAEFDARLIQPELEQYGTFGLGWPGYGWALYVEPSETPDYFYVELKVFEDRELIGDEELNDVPDEARILASATTWRASPPTIDLTGGSGGIGGGGSSGGGQTPSLSDLGLEETLNGLGIDPTNFDPAMLSRLDIETLQSFMPMLVGIVGQDRLQQLLNQAGAGGLMDDFGEDTGDSGDGQDGGGSGSPDQGMGGGPNELPEGSPEEQFEFLLEQLEQRRSGGGR